MNSMNMNMPGFTAEASVYRRGAYYQIGAMLAGLERAGEIVPSLPINWSDCRWYEGGTKHCCVFDGDRGTQACCCSLHSGCICSYQPH